MSNYDIGWATGTTSVIAVFVIHNGWIGFLVCLAINIIGGQVERTRRVRA